LQENLPTEDRQTLLFSATQTRSVKDLARLSLEKPVFVSVHEHSDNATPEKLTQSYIVCELSDKINTLWSFIKNHRKKKILVFLQSCKQVKYVNDLFKRLKCGTSTLALHGKLHQLRRMAIYDEFCQRQTSVVLLATDVASRGLGKPWPYNKKLSQSSTMFLNFRFSGC
jgi:ATP-dependent RNA helicase DDX10/DBP4